MNNNVYELEDVTCPPDKLKKCVPLFKISVNIFQPWSFCDLTLLHVDNQGIIFSVHLRCIFRTFSS